jgi:hypothetical protein
VRGLKFWLPVGLSIAVTPVCLLLAVGSGGAGHGDYFLAKVLFPFAILSTRIFDSITFPFLALAVAQFPIYGIILGRAHVKSKLPTAAAAILIAHALSVAACLLIPGGNFS